MGGVDWLCALVLAAFLVRGLCRGLLVESLAFFGLLLSAAAALLGASRAAAALTAFGLPGALSPLLAAVGLFLLGLLLTDGAEQLARAHLQGWRRTRTDRAGGALAGLLKGALVLGLAAALLQHSAAPLLLRRPVEEAVLPRLLAPAARGLYRLARPVIPTDLLERGRALAVELTGLEIRPPTPPAHPAQAPGPGPRPA